MSVSRDLFWVEKYRPKTIDEAILPAAIKAKFQGFANQKLIPNMILDGTPGLGKTTIARALCEQLGADYIEINGSLERNMDTLRNKIVTYCSTISMANKGRKVVIINEADNLNAEFTQKAFRGVIEDHPRVSFVFTCNHKGKLHDALQSRMPAIDFVVPKEEHKALKIQTLRRISQILEAEGIKYDKGALVAGINKYFPDLRRLIGELQIYAACGQIDVGFLTVASAEVTAKLFTALKAKNYKEMRLTLANSAESPDIILSALFNNLYDIFDKDSIPAATVLAAKYQYQNSHVANKELNLAAMFAEMMIECDMVSANG